MIKYGSIYHHSQNVEAEHYADEHSMDSEKAHSAIHKLKNENGRVNSADIPRKTAKYMQIAGISSPEDVDVNISYQRAFILVAINELWIILNSLLVWGFGVSTCFDSYLTSLFFTSEFMFGIGFGSCSIEGPFEITYVIFASLVSSIFMVIVVLECVIHFVSITIKYGENSVFLIHYIAIGIITIVFFILATIQMSISDYDFYTSIFLVFSTWFTTGYVDPTFNTTGLLLVIFAVHVCTPTFAYLIGFFGGALWNKFVKAKNVEILSYEIDLQHTEEFLEKSLKTDDNADVASDVANAMVKIEKYMLKIHKMENVHLKEGAMERILLKKLENHKNSIAAKKETEQHEIQFKEEEKDSEEAEEFFI